MFLFLVLEIPVFVGNIRMAPNINILQGYDFTVWLQIHMFNEDLLCGSWLDVFSEKL